jgi:hypothetical protein
MGAFGGRFSPVDQGPPQPFNINQATPIQYQAAWTRCRSRWFRLLDTKTWWKKSVTR